MNGRPLAVVIALFLAGCLAPEAPTEVLEAATAPTEGVLAGLDVQATDCDEGGGHSVYQRAWLSDLLPEPWVAADVAEDLGRPLVTSYGYPAGDELTGIYHTTVVCASWTLDGVAQDGPLVYGWVGIPVEAPPFDDGAPAGRHYLLDVLTFEPPVLRDRLDALGVHVSAGFGTLTWKQDVLVSTLDDEHHGLYEAVLPMKPHGDMAPGPIRLWMLHEHGDGYAPASLDLANAGGKHWVVDGQGAFSHSRTKDHEPLPGGWGNVAALAFTDFDRAIALGPAPDVALEENWAH